MKGFYKDTVKTSVTKPDLKAKTMDQTKKAAENYKKCVEDHNLATNVVNKKYDATYRAELTKKLRETNKH